METSGCKVCDFALDALQNNQFWLGVLVGIVVAVVLYLIWKCIALSGAQHREITVEDSDRGNFTVTSAALISFVRNAAASCKAIEITGLRLVERKEGLVMVIYIKASPDTEVAKYLGQLRKDLIIEMKDKLGIFDQIKAINFEAQELVTKAKEA